jgi:hypothetical protein
MTEVRVDPFLLQLVLSLEAAAMQQMGKLQNPLTGKIDRDLVMAKNSIDMLAMIERKTLNNLSEEEDRLLKRALYQLRMNYVDELKSPESGQPAESHEDKGNVGAAESAAGEADAEQS